MRIAAACVLALCALAGPPIIGCSLSVDTNGLTDARNDQDGSVDETGEGGTPDTTYGDEAGTEGGSVGRDAATDAPVCPIIVGANPCSDLPRFTGTQVVDGIGSEFCDIIATEFIVADGAYVEMADGGTVVSTKADIRTAWSSIGLHIHVHVAQNPVRPPPSGTSIWMGDGLEIFASATGNLTGPFGPGGDPAVQVIVTPPSDAQPALSSVSMSTVGIVRTLDRSMFAGRLVPDGYELELQLPWSVISGDVDAGPSPAAGSSIGYDLACDVQGADGSLMFQSSLSSKSPSGGVRGSCTSGDVRPYCDDQIWCKVKLL